MNRRTRIIAPVHGSLLRDWLLGVFASKEMPARWKYCAVAYEARSSLKFASQVLLLSHQSIKLEVVSRGKKCLDTNTENLIAHDAGSAFLSLTFDVRAVTDGFSRGG